MLLLRKVLLLLNLLLCLWLLPHPAWAIGVGANAAALMDVNSGEVLYGKNMNQKMPMASLTKIMTALLAAESGKLDHVVTVHPEAVKVEPTNIWLLPSEKITLSNLVYGLMMRSGNDAALAIAYYLAGGIEDFAQMMNARARELGAFNTNFVNPTGLPHRDHLSSAYDLALMTRALLQNPFLQEVVATERHESEWDNHSRPRVWHNSNRLLQIMPGADGVKTGWTRTAGHCLASSATRQGWQLLSIVLNSPDHYGENRALLEWGFKNYHPVRIVEKGIFLGSITVKNGSPSSIGAVTAGELTWVEQRGKQLDLRTTVLLPESLQPPIEAHQHVGQLIVTVEGLEVARVPLVSDQKAVEKSWLRRLQRTVREYVLFVHRPMRTLI